MKKLLMVVLGVIMMSQAYADNAKLRMKIAGTLSDNRYFLCVSHVGCVSILNGNKGKVYPMDTGAVSNIVAINLKDRRMDAQALPSSCQITVNDNQTVTVSGKLTQDVNKKVIIKNLHCSVS